MIEGVSRRSGSTELAPGRSSVTCRDSKPVRHPPTCARVVSIVPSDSRFYGSLSNTGRVTAQVRVRAFMPSCSHREPRPTLGFSGLTGQGDVVGGPRAADEVSTSGCLSGPHNGDFARGIMRSQQCAWRGDS